MGASVAKNPRTDSNIFCLVPYDCASDADLWPHEDFVGEHWLEEKANWGLKQLNCSGGNVRSFHCPLWLPVMICATQQLICRLKGKKINRKHSNKDRQDPRWSRPPFCSYSRPFMFTKCFPAPSFITIQWQVAEKVLILRFSFYKQRKWGSEVWWLASE